MFVRSGDANTRGRGGPRLTGSCRPLDYENCAGREQVYAVTRLVDPGDLDRSLPTGNY